MRGGLCTVACIFLQAIGVRQGSAIIAPLSLCWQKVTSLSLLLFAYMTLHKASTIIQYAVSFNLVKSYYSEGDLLFVPDRTCELTSFY